MFSVKVSYTLTKREAASRIEEVLLYYVTDLPPVMLVTALAFKCKNLLGKISVDILRMCC